ncbi:protein SRC2 [Beta vulgaris subsp. vulgaris]|uniref:protein SRC2 n=1 Tax=Beta vulgaris subsp. vulgaris TaxID=3555 RepID=UPI00203699E7|nr:protein SRC2 [Beta vulgaris subsp. vulgaris]
MEHRPIDVKLLCAKDLKDVNVFSTMDVYVVGSVSGDPRSMQRTAVDKDGGTNPKWNHDMKFTFDESAARLNRLGLVFQIMSDRTLGDKEIGRVYVPLKELFDATDPIDQERHVVYQVQTPTGKFKGEMEFSFKFGEIFTLKLEPKIDEPVIAYPALGSTTLPELDPTLACGPTLKSGTNMYSCPNVSGPMHYSHSAPQLGYQPQGYGYGYGYRAQNVPVPMPVPPPNPHMGYGYGFTGGYGCTGQTPPCYVQPPMSNKPKKSKFGIGAAAGVGAGLLGGLLVGEMVEDVAESVAFDDTLDF